VKYSDFQRVKKIYENADRLYKYVCDNDITREKLMKDFSVQWLVTTLLANIGEHAHNLTEEYKKSHSDIPWNKLAGLRHRLVHDYDGIHWEMIAEILFEDLPVLTDKINDLLNEGDTN